MHDLDFHGNPNIAAALTCAGCGEPMPGIEAIVRDDVNRFKLATGVPVEQVSFAFLCVACSSSRKHIRWESK